MNEYESNHDTLIIYQRENYRLRAALHDAINSPKGVVPESADEFYNPVPFYPDEEINE